MSSTTERALIEQISESMMPLLARIDRMAMDWLTRRLAEYGVSLSEFRIIGALLGEEQGIAQNALAGKLRIEPATLSIALSKLEAKGLVTRDPDPNDTRVRRVRCARQIPQFAQIKVVLEQLDKAALTGVAPDEIEVARRVLLQVEGNLVALSK